MSSLLFNFLFLKSVLIIRVRLKPSHHKTDKDCVCVCVYCSIGDNGNLSYNN